MKPYFKDSSVTIYHADWREVLGQLPVADCIVTDPPYGETSLNWDTLDVSWLAPFADAVSLTGSLWTFGSFKFLACLLNFSEPLRWRHAQEVIWEKHNGSGFHADRFKRVHEIALQLYRIEQPWGSVYKKPVVTDDAVKRRIHRRQRPAHMGDVERGQYSSEDGGPRLMRSVIYSKNCHGEAEHPTQKPLEILRPLISYSCPPGGLVVDPFMGSGSTLLAAREFGCRSIGVEISEEYCAAAVRRLAQMRLA